MPTHTPQHQAMQAQQMAGGGAAQTGPAEMQAQAPDPAQAVQEMGLQLAQAIGPEQASALFIQVGQAIAQQGGGPGV